MLILKPTADLLRVITTVGGSSIKCSVHYVEVNDTAGPPPTVTKVDLVNTAPITTATTTTILDATVADRSRRVLYAALHNDHATVTETVEVIHSDGATVSPIIQCTLLAGESLIYNGAGTWLHYDTNGALYPSVGNVATQVDMETATSLVKYVSPGRQQYHPGHPKCWGKVTVAAGTPTLQVNYNLTSITDTATGDIVFTIATDFSVANWCCLHSIEAITGTFVVASARNSHIKFATQAVGTISLQCIDKTVTTNLLKDPTAWHMCGLGDQA
jgi:tellurite resistance-related uncharacterized protein